MEPNHFLYKIHNLYRENKLPENFVLQTSVVFKTLPKLNNRPIWSPCSAVLPDFGAKKRKEEKGDLPDNSRRSW
jgi:hypothetical protein